MSRNTRRKLGVLVTLAMAFSFVMVLASPAMATHATIVQLHPVDNALATPDARVSSRTDGVDTTVHLTAVTNNNQDTETSDHVHWYWQVTNGAGIVGSPLNFIGTSNTATAPILSPTTGGWKAFEFDWDTTSIPNGSVVDVIAVSCGDGEFGDDDHTGGFPASDCGSGTSGPGFDEQIGVIVDNSQPAVEIVTAAAEHGDMVSNSGFTVTASSTAGLSQDMEFALCPGVTPQTGFEGPLPSWFGGAGCIEYAGTPNATNSMWTATFTDADVALDHYALYAWVDQNAAGGIQPANGSGDVHYVGGAQGVVLQPKHVHMVWDASIAGDGDCHTGASTATSPIDPYALGPNATFGYACVFNVDETGLDNVLLAYDTTGVGFVDSDTFDSARPGNVDDDVDGDGLSEPCAASTTRVGLGYPPCQDQDQTGDYGQGITAFYVNSTVPGQQVVTGCIDWNGDSACGAGEESDTATMNWVANAPTHNHLSQSGTATAACHNGVVDITVPAGTAVDLTGCFNDAHHNPVPNVPVLWRTLSGDPVSYDSQETNSGADGLANATVRSNTANTTSSIGFCGDAVPVGGDGLCDVSLALVQIHWTEGTTPPSGTCPGFESDPRPQIVGTAGGEVLTGTAADEIICGLGGDDELNGMGGDDILVGGEGSDVLRGGDGNDWIDGEGGNDRMSGGNGNDSLFGSDGADLIYGNGGTDAIVGGEGDDRIVGGDGNDSIHAGNGDDLAWGQGGQDTIYGNAGDDRISGGADDDAIVGGSGNDQVWGVGGNDRLWGQADDDRIYGNAGDDRIDGGSGDDALVGSNGDDTIVGGSGLDNTWGQNGNDTIYINDGASGDTANGGGGTDTCSADGGDAVSNC